MWVKGILVFVYSLVLILNEVIWYKLDILMVCSCDRYESFWMEWVVILWYWFKVRFWSWVRFVVMVLILGLVILW